MTLLFDYNLQVLALLVIITISQAIFGVGILLWGTPIFLLYGLTFPETISILVPLSLIISWMQVIPHFREVNQTWIIKFLVFSIPTLIVGMFISLFFSFNLKLIVSGVLILSLCYRMPGVSNLLLKYTQKYDPLILSILGFIHGLSNLGGPLLVLRVSFENFTIIKYRTTVAACYFLLALSQIFTLYFYTGSVSIQIFYSIFTLMIYFVCERYIFFKITGAIYYNVLEMLLLLFALLLFIDYFFNLT